MQYHTLRWLIILNILLLFIAFPASAEIMLSTGARYDMFSDDHSPKTVGYELTVPIGLLGQWERFAFSIDTALSGANVLYGAGEDAELTSLTDTYFTATYALLTAPIGISLGIDTDLPTGAERLNANERAAEVGENHDLFEVDDFGEGFDFGVNLGLAKAFGAVSLSLNGGYRFNGEYDPTSDIEDDDYDPGDQTRIAALLKWQASTQFSLDASMAYAHFTEDKRDGSASFQEGDRLSLGETFKLNTQIGKPMSIVFALQQTFQAKNKALSADGMLYTEPENVNGSEFFGTLDLLYSYSSRCTLRMIGDIRYYGESDLQNDEAGLPYDGQRIRYGFGPGVIYQPNAHIGLNGLFKYFILDQSKDIQLPQDATFHGANVSIGMTYTF
ncbi:hypothetical protein U14_00697 [Candidatus Moduliflexus flocculans]|uniref:Outer membrane protein beta-barrel domain-containing protein n=1 Tax=Candidatus Moduliflexus flocculans TaxID=1499966 RepID=A0A0S6VW02_9BACT|nr:hypothetical protein U14_00697 [Candidatus Moduliflexus flocculans]